MAGEQVEPRKAVGQQHAQRRGGKAKLLAGPSQRLYPAQQGLFLRCKVVMRVCPPRRRRKFSAVRQCRCLTVGCAAALSFLKAQFCGTTRRPINPRTRRDFVAVVVVILPLGGPCGPGDTVPASGSAWRASRRPSGHGPSLVETPGAILVPAQNAVIAADGRPCTANMRVAKSSAKRTRPFIFCSASRKIPRSYIVSRRLCRHRTKAHCGG